MMMFQVKTLSPLMKVSTNDKRIFVPCKNIGLEVCVGHIFLCVSPDMIYEDVQKDSVPLEADNGWSSSEFESYEEQSDSEAKPPTRSKV